MKLIHTADLHLDSPIRSLGDPEKSAARRDEILATFGRIVRLARAQSAQAVLIAGDLFDSHRVTTRALQYLLEQVRSCPEVRFFCLRGNHDRAAFTQADGLPDNLCLFDGELRGYALSDGVMLYGTENPFALADAAPFDAERFNIAMLHGDLSNFAADAPDSSGVTGVTGVSGASGMAGTLPLSRFAGKNINYLALGHIHEGSEGRLDDRGIYRYPGCPNGRGFDECGEKGVVLLEIDGQRCTRTFLPTCDRVYHDVTADLTGCTDTATRMAKIRAAVGDIPDRDALRLTLTGERPEGCPVDDLRIREEYARLFGFRLHDRTDVAVDTAALAGEISLRGEFLRLVLASDLSPEEKRQTLLCGLAALSGDRQ